LILAQRSDGHDKSSSESTSQSASGGDQAQGCRYARATPFRGLPVLIVALTEKKPAAGSSKDKEAKAGAAKKAALKGTHSHALRKVHNSVSFHRPKTLRLRRAPKYPRKRFVHCLKSNDDDGLTNALPFTLSTNLVFNYFLPVAHSFLLFTASHMARDWTNSGRSSRRSTPSRR
jgi:hypothetical protein